MIGPDRHREDRRSPGDSQARPGPRFLEGRGLQYTEVGYGGADVESMIRDLTELSVNMVKAGDDGACAGAAEQLAEERHPHLLLPHRTHEPFSSGSLERSRPTPRGETTKDKLRVSSGPGRLRRPDGRARDAAACDADDRGPLRQGMEEMGLHLKDMLSNLMPTRTKRRRVRIADARRLLVQEEGAEARRHGGVVAQAIRRARTRGSSSSTSSTDRGAEAATARCLARGRPAGPAPIVEARPSRPSTGSCAPTHVLFIAAGASTSRSPRTSSRSSRTLSDPRRARPLDGARISSAS